MASPVDALRTTNSTGGTANTNHVVSVAALTPAAGELLVILIRFTTAPGSVTSAGGKWTQLVSDVSDASDDQTMIWYRLCDGAEALGSLDLTSVNSVKSINLVWKITGAADPATRAPETSTVAIGTTTANTANPASCSVTGGPKDVLYLALCGYDGVGGVPTAAPTNYTNLNTRAVTGGATASNGQVGGASRQISASSSDDPGVFTHPAANTGWTAWTVVIHPPAAAGAPIPDVAMALAVT